MKAPPASGPPQPDPLADVLDLARQEGALEGEGMAAFRAALRERADLVLAERLEPLETRRRALEAETAWRRDAMTTLEASVRSLGEQRDTLSAELGKASDAHGALLAHHRELVERVARELASIAALSPLRARQARRRLRALAELLRVDSR
jgi:hypothetical protein